MKPEDLVPPCSKQEQKTLIYDRVWYIPSQARPVESASFTFPGWQSADLFGNNHPIAVEYCSGNGAWIAQKALDFPTVNWVAVERKFERVRKIWCKIKNLNLNNQIVICGEASRATNLYFPDGSIQEIYINFPDPWPKKRHAKNRLIQPSFVEELSRILRSNGTVTFVTDDVAYSDWTIDIFLQSNRFRSLHPTPFYVTDEQAYGNSFFDSLWRSKGRTIRYHQFSKDMG